MKPILYAAAIVALASLSAQAEEKGKVVMTISAGPETNFLDYLLFFRTADSGHQDSIRYGQHNWLFGTGRDFDDAQNNGVVKVLDLAAGDWKIDNFLFTDYLGSVRPLHPFEVHFTVKPGATTYIGDYRVHADPLPPSYEKEQFVRVYFSVSDQSARDIPIARKKDSAIADVVVALPEIPPHTPNFLPHANEPADAAAAPARH